MVTTITSLFAILIIWLLWQFLWKDYVIDKMRDDLFLIRNKLFDIALDNNEFNFNSDLYKSFEQIINNTIRFGYKINFISTILLMTMRTVKFPKYKMRSRFSLDFNRFINSSIDSKLRNDISQLKKEYERAVIFFMFKSSTIFQLCFIIVLTKILISNVFHIFNSNILLDSYNIVKSKYQKKYIVKFEYQAEYQN